MSKDAAAWLALRIIGLLVLGNALFYCVELVTRIFALVEINGLNLDSASEKLLSQRVGSLWSSIIISAAQGVASFALAYYFLLRGALVHRWLMRENA